MIFYGYPPCSTCRQAQKLLETLGLKFDYVNLKEAPPSPEQLKDLIERSGLGIGRFFNTSGQLYREMDLKHQRESLSEDEQIALLSKHGMLIKRPILDTGKTVIVGRNEAAYQQLVEK